MISRSKAADLDPEISFRSMSRTLPNPLLDPGSDPLIWAPKRWFPWSERSICLFRSFKMSPDVLNRSQMCSNRLFCCFKCFLMLFLAFSLDLRRIPIEIHPFPSQIDPTYSRYFLKYLIMGIHTHTQGPTHTHRTYRGAAGDRTGGAGGGTCYLEKTDPTFFGALWLTPRCLETRFWPFLETHFDDFASIESILRAFEWFYADFVLFLLSCVPLG